MIWNVGKIVASGRPGAFTLIQKILLLQATTRGDLASVLAIGSCQSTT